MHHDADELSQQGMHVGVRVRVFAEKGKEAVVVKVVVVKVVVKVVVVVAVLLVV